MNAHKGTSAKGMTDVVTNIPKDTNAIGMRAYAGVSIRI